MKVAVRKPKLGAWLSPRRCRVQRLVSAAIVVTLLESCGSNPVQNPGDDAIPDSSVSRYVTVLCEALDRFQELEHEMPTPPPGGEIKWRPSVIAALDAWTRWTSVLISELEAAGFPKVNGGQELALKLLFAARRSLDVLHDARQRAASLPDAELAPFASGYREIFPPAMGTTAAVRATIYFLVTRRFGDMGPDEVTVYLTDPVDPGILDSLTGFAQALPHVESVVHEGKAEACVRFKEVFSDQPALVDNVDCNELPESLRIQSSGVDSVEGVMTALQGHLGVEKVVTQQSFAMESFGFIGLTWEDFSTLSPLHAAARQEAACTKALQA
jgi:hypothetical protein